MLSASLNKKREKKKKKRFIQMVHGMDILWLVISMRLPDSASIFTAEVWAIIKALEFSCIQIYYFYRLTFVSPSFYSI